MLGRHFDDRAAADAQETDLSERPVPRGVIRRKLNITPRGLLWMTLLGVGDVDVARYVRIVRRGPAPNGLGNKIGLDVGRTLKNHVEFHARVPSAAITRVLNAYCHHCEGT